MATLALSQPRIVQEPDSAPRSAMRAGLGLASCVAVLALPSAMLAFATNLRHAHAVTVVDPLTAATDSLSLAREMALRSLAKGQRFPFTPAGTPNRPERAVTVAVRVDPEAAKAIIVHGHIPLPQADDSPTAAANRMRIAPAAFNLGVSRGGYQSFSQQNLVPPSPAPHDIQDLPDLKRFNLTPGGNSKADPSRFSTRLSFDDKHPTGRSPRSYAGDSNEVDVGGAYRVTKNLDVTAGVRYTQDRERLMPLTDGKLDSQAVYLGTQFKF
ncbi:hypothetical protein [Novosphingobium sp. 9]|uniref:hypothetical protein n=1 Tax=Novosphingobium sp. 9 TaxID=2025349 RepID=UPI0021B5B586|nr:hypothetical protein [Novosphingobium sp. 9]